MNYKNNNIEVHETTLFYHKSSLSYIPSTNQHTHKTGNYVMHTVNYKSHSAPSIFKLGARYGRLWARAWFKN